MLKHSLHSPSVEVPDVGVGAGGNQATSIGTERSRLHGVIVGESGDRFSSDRVPYAHLGAADGGDQLGVRAQERAHDRLPMDEWVCDWSERCGVPQPGRFVTGCENPLAIAGEYGGGSGTAGDFSKKLGL